MSETAVKCETCDGSGFNPAMVISGIDMQCPACGGSGHPTNKWPFAPRETDKPTAPDAGEREPEAGSEVCPRCHCTMNDKQESVITNHSDQDRPRREHEKLSGCAQALMHERPKLLAHLDRQAARIAELEGQRDNALAGAADNADWAGSAEVDMRKAQEKLAQLHTQHARLAAVVENARACRQYEEAGDTMMRAADVLAALDARD